MDRLPRELRAGTLLDHRFTIPVEAREPKSKRIVQCGWIDQSQFVYQGGGDAKDFIYWKLHLVTFQGDLWVQLTGPLAHYLRYVELIDNAGNRVYRIPFYDAVQNGRWYEDKIGVRWGVPIDLWKVYDSQLTATTTK